jgi:hypothetical protein
LTLALEEEPSDVLGRTFHDLELHNKWSGQFFSPYSLCRMMAKVMLGGEEDVRAKIAARGFVTAQEPCCGSGAIVEEFGRWYTPAHIMDGWTWKLRREPEATHEVQSVPETPKPERPGPDDSQTPPSQLTLF